MKAAAAIREMTFTGTTRRNPRPPAIASFGPYLAPGTAAAAVLAGQSRAGQARGAAGPGLIPAGQAGGQPSAAAKRYEIIPQSATVHGLASTHRWRPGNP